MVSGKQVFKKFFQFTLHCSLFTAVFPLEFCIFRGSGEGDDIADVLHSGDIHDCSFESESESGVRVCAESAEVKIPPVVFFIESKFLNSFNKFVISFFPLTSADDLTDSRNKEVSCGNSSVVVVKPHVKSFDLFWIVIDKKIGRAHV